MPPALDIAAVLRRYERAKQARAAWEPIWRECHDYTVPVRTEAGFGQRGLAAGAPLPGGRLFDGTAPDAVDQLAASLLARLTPPWSRWFGLAPGRELLPDESRLAGPELDAIAEAMQTQFDRSNFAVEIHQCYLDLVTAGTACLLFEEAPVGAESAFRFAAVPLAEVHLEEGPDGRLDTMFRRTELSGEAFRARFPDAALDPDEETRLAEGDELRIAVLEAVLPDGHAYRYMALREGAARGDRARALLAEGRFDRPPFIAFRWLKAPGEAYGRSPVMKALPDIKTANKVVELVLKNASIAVTGIWQAEDDGVLNPANVKLVPGTIIPKAQGSSGLTPLDAPGRFDVSQLVLDDLRTRIRHALLADTLGPVDGPRMTATEVLERTSETARLLGATYGRLQSELLTPLIQRGLAILRRRKEIADISADGRIVALQYRSPLAQDRGLEDVQTVMRWAEMAGGLGAEAGAVIDAPAAARWMARALGVPSVLVKPEAAAAGPAPDPAGLAGLAQSALAALGGPDGIAAGLAKIGLDASGLSGAGTTYPGARHLPNKPGNKEHAHAPV